MCQEFHFVWVKQPECEADFLLALSIEAENVRSFTSTPTCDFIAGKELSYVIVGVFWKLRKAIISFVMSVSLWVRTEYFRFH
jgi:hypothetical protein